MALPKITTRLQPTDAITSPSIEDSSSILSPTLSTSSDTSFLETSIPSTFSNKRSLEEEGCSILQKLSNSIQERDLAIMRERQEEAEVSASNRNNPNLSEEYGSFGGSNVNGNSEINLHQQRSTIQNPSNDPQPSNRKVGSQDLNHPLSRSLTSVNLTIAAMEPSSLHPPLPQAFSTISSESVGHPASHPSRRRHNSLILPRNRREYAALGEVFQNPELAEPKWLWENKFSLEGPVAIPETVLAFSGSSDQTITTNPQDSLRGIMPLVYHSEPSSQEVLPISTEKVEKSHNLQQSAASLNLLPSATLAKLITTPSDQTIQPFNSASSFDEISSSTNSVPEASEAQLSKAREYEFPDSGSSSTYSDRHKPPSAHTIVLPKIFCDADPSIFDVLVPDDDPRIITWGSEPPPLPAVPTHSHSTSTVSRAPSSWTLLSKHDTDDTKSNTIKTKPSRLFSSLKRGASLVVHKASSGSLREERRPERKNSSSTISDVASMAASTKESKSINSTIIAATAEKLIEKLTTGLDYNFLTDFFLTYRTFLTPTELCKLLILRFRWALENDDEDRRIVRIRTFVTIRHWLLNYFAHDFLASRELRVLLTNYLNELPSHPLVRGSVRDQRIVIGLKKVVRRCKEIHYGRKASSRIRVVSPPPPSLEHEYAQRLARVRLSTPLHPGVGNPHGKNTAVGDISLASVRVVGSLKPFGKRKGSGSPSNQPAAVGKNAEMKEREKEERQRLASISSDESLNEELSAGTTAGESTGELDETEDELDVSEMADEETRAIKSERRKREEAEERERANWFGVPVKKITSVVPATSNSARQIVVDMEKRNTRLKASSTSQSTRPLNANTRNKTLARTSSQGSRKNIRPALHDELFVSIPRSRSTPVEGAVHDNFERLMSPSRKSAIPMGAVGRQAGKAITRVRSVPALSNLHHLPTTGSNDLSFELMRQWMQNDFSKSLSQPPITKQRSGNLRELFQFNDKQLPPLPTITSSKPTSSSSPFLSTFLPNDQPVSKNLSANVAYPQPRLSKTVGSPHSSKPEAQHPRKMKSLNSVKVNTLTITPSVPMTSPSQQSPIRRKKKVSMPLVDIPVMAASRSTLTKALGKVSKVLQPKSFSEPPELATTQTSKKPLQVRGKRAESMPIASSGSLQDVRPLNEQLPTAIADEGHRSPNILKRRSKSLIAVADKPRKEPVLVCECVACLKLDELQEEDPRLNILCQRFKSFDQGPELRRGEDFENLNKNFGEGKKGKRSIREKPLPLLPGHLGKFEDPRIGGLSRKQEYSDLKESRFTAEFATTESVLLPPSPPGILSGDELVNSPSSTRSLRKIPKLHDLRQAQSVRADTEDKLRHRRSLDTTISGVSFVDSQAVNTGSSRFSRDPWGRPITSGLLTRNRSASMAEGLMGPQAERRARVEEYVMQQAKMVQTKEMATNALGSKSDSNPEIPVSALLEFTNSAKLLLPLPVTPIPPRKSQELPGGFSYRPFILNHRSEAIVKQFCLIERDILLEVQWEELVLMGWKKGMASAAPSFAEREADRKKVHSPKNGVPNLVARFNMVCQWVATEIVSTKNLDERVKVIEKFIRIANQCRLYCNFATLVQILLGLQSSSVSRLRKTWLRVSATELKLLTSLSHFTTPFKNWKHIRDSMNHVADEHGNAPQEVLFETPSTSSNKSIKDWINPKGTVKIPFGGCIPFMGVYLSDLIYNAEQPSYVDPKLDKDTKLQEAIRIYKNEAPVEISPLRQQPLVNFHKHRITATIIRKVLTFQRLSKRYPFQIEENLYNLCAQLRCADNEVVRRLSRDVEPESTI